MRMPRVQFTIRRIMIVIAAIAVVLGVGLEGWRLKRFRDQCLMKAQFLGLLEQNSLIMEKSIVMSAESSNRISEMHSELAGIPTGETQSSTSAI